MINVLIIEDDMMVANNIKKYLKLHFDEHIDIIGMAESGRKAELLLDSPTKYNIILWDYVLADGKSSHLVDFFPNDADVILMSIDEQALIDSIRNKWNSKFNSFEPISTREKRELITEPKNKILASDSLLYHLIDNKIKALNFTEIELPRLNEPDVKIHVSDIALITNAKEKYVSLRSENGSASAYKILDNSKIIFSNKNELIISENKYNSVSHFLKEELKDHETHFLNIGDALINYRCIRSSCYSTSNAITISVMYNMQSNTAVNIKKDGQKYTVKPVYINQFEIDILTINSKFKDIEEALKSHNLL